MKVNEKEKLENRIKQLDGENMILAGKLMENSNCHVAFTMIANRINRNERLKEVIKCALQSDE